MGNLKAKSGAKREPRELIPARKYKAVIIGVCDLGTQESKFGEKQKVMIVWELHTKRGPSLDSKGGVFTIAQDFNLSFSEYNGTKAKLRAVVEDILGKTFTDEEAEEGFDIEKLVGMGCDLTVVHNKDKAKPDKIWANIGGVLALDEDEEPPTPISDTFYYEVDPSREIPSDVPKWLQWKIVRSTEWVKVHGEPEDSRNGKSAKPDNPLSGQNGTANTDADDDEDDYIPF